MRVEPTRSSGEKRRDGTASGARSSAIGRLDADAHHDVSASIGHTHDRGGPVPAWEIMIWENVVAVAEEIIEL